MNAYEVLGTRERLVIGDDELREAFREAGKRAHPDAGGGEGEFSALKEAMNVLASPSRRLRHWLSLRGLEVDPRGVIGGGLMDLFARIGAVTQRAEAMIRKRAETKSALAKALLEGEVQVCREQIEDAIAQVDSGIAEASAEFTAWENGGEINRAAAEEAVRNLAFLEKWRAALRGCYSRLV